MLKKKNKKKNLGLATLLQEQVYHSNPCSRLSLKFFSRRVKTFNGFRVRVITDLNDLTAPPVTLMSVCLQADNDHIMGFHQCFILKNTGESWVCTNDMFRLAIHNFG